MPLSQTFAARERPEPRALPKPVVVLVSVLQLALVVLVWLLALVPMAVVALGAAAFQALKPATAKVPARTVLGS